MSEHKFVKVEHPDGDRHVIVGACHRDPHRAEHTHYDSSQFAGDDLPEFVDLRPHLTEVEDQGELGSCTANALAGAVEYLEVRLNGNGERVSRLFLYWNERDIEGKADKDAGACLDDGIRALRQDGICAEDTWPYDTDQVFEEPEDDAYDEASNHTIDEAHRVKIDLHDMRHCLAEGYPFVFGLQVYKPFHKVGDDGRVPHPTNPSEHSGGHAMLCVGYSDKDEVFVVRNSWGPKWGDQGYCYIPYSYMADPQFAHDAWTLRRAHDLDFNQGAAGADLPHGKRASFFDDPDADDTDDPESDDPEADDPEADDPEADDPESDDPEADDPEGDDPESDDPGEDDPDADDPEGDDDEKTEEELTEEIAQLEKNLEALKAEGARLEAQLKKPKRRS